MNDKNNNEWIHIYSGHDYYIRKESIIGIRTQGIPYSLGRKKYFLILSNQIEIEVEEFHMRDQNVFDALGIKE